MKRFLSALAAVLILFLCACGQQPATEPEAAESPAPTEEPAPTATAAPTAPAPTLSPGAAELALRGECFGRGPDGELYTSLSRSDGLVCLYDVVPEDAGFVVRFVMTDAGIYAATKSEYFTLDPATLWFFPADGSEAWFLAKDVSPDGRFLLTSDALFYTEAETGYLRRVGLTGTGAIYDPVRLLDTDGGFIYYAKDDGVYRNDSTLGAEERLFEPASLSVRAGGGRLYSLSHADGAAAVELREKDGSLAVSVPLDAETDNIAYDDGRLYVPQSALDEILILDAETGDESGSLPLLDGGTYCLILYVDKDTVWYETVLDGEIVLCRTSEDGAESLGQELLY